MKKDNLKPLAITFSCKWSLGYNSWHNVSFYNWNWKINRQSTYAYFLLSIFLASFFFCFAYLQFMSASNIRRYSFVVGCLIIGRSFYVFQLYGSLMLFCKDFPSTFWFTGIIDAFFTLLYFYLLIVESWPLKTYSYHQTRIQNLN